MTEHGGMSSKDSQIEEYRMHVSQRYLDLTQEKLRLARLPRDILDPSSAQQPSIDREHLDHLLDEWQERFDFRDQEAAYNRCLPQYRTNIAVRRRFASGDETLRIHFVHKRSSHQDAIPLLVCHDFGSSFIEIARAIDALCEPSTTPPAGDPQAQAFHVVCPSIPGFGYSDMSKDEHFGLEQTARVFRSLMGRLGYDRFVVHGTGWGFRICQMMAHIYPYQILAVHTVNPEVPAPVFIRAPLVFLGYHAARFLHHIGLSSSTFGYAASDFALQKTGELHASALTVGSEECRSLSFALADSPTGLLAFSLSLLRPSDTTKVPINSYWSNADILTWTMLYWLPGPEAPLRWLCNARAETASHGSVWRYTRVPLGVSSFAPDMRSGGTPPPWTRAYHRLCWLRRHEEHVRWPLWEAHQAVVLDLRAFVTDMRTCETIRWTSSNDKSQMIDSPQLLQS